MKKEVDMTYRFTWDTEPTDEQLQQLMEEVAEEVRQKKAEREELHLQRLRDEAQKAKTEHDSKYGKTA
ncbi:MAG: hypothetical protein LBD28_02870 [Tannerellaceae bacterium]|jgi:glutamate dehydrogenase/leucine dehydrogenase|nr:hypothetical protein [Tannerellaceae bacterium]